MANDLRARRGKSSNSSGRNEAGNGRRLDGLKKARGGFDLNSVDRGVVLGTVFNALSHGGAIRFGLTRDGGALALGVYIDGDSETVYLNKDDDPQTFWLEVNQVFDPELTLKDIFGAKTAP